MVHRQASVLAKCVHRPKESIETGNRLWQGVKVASRSLLRRIKESLVSHIRLLIKDACLQRMANPKVHLVSLVCLTWVVKAPPQSMIRTSRHDRMLQRDLASSPAYRPLELRYWQRCSPHLRMMIKTVCWTSKVKFRCLRSPSTRLASLRSRKAKTSRTKNNAENKRTTMSMAQVVIYEFLQYKELFQIYCSFNH